MKEGFIAVNHQIRETFKNVFNFTTLILIFQILTIILLVNIYLDLEDDNFHLYMNTKRSLEEIHNVKIDSYDGRLSRQLTTEEQLVRKQNRRWHLRNLFK